MPGRLAASLPQAKERSLVSEPSQTPHSVVWKRRDSPGHEACRIISTDDGWDVRGTAVFVFESQACRLDYSITCDAHWVTRTATVSGWVGTRTIEILVERTALGNWHLNGREVPEVAGCIDIDLNFSPSTNLLPIRRLGLAVGETAPIRAAWLRFPSFVLEPLDQSYTRIDPTTYRYESAGGRFVAPVTVDDTGLAIDYGDIWSREGPHN